MIISSIWPSWLERPLESAAGAAEVKAGCAGKNISRGGMNSRVLERRRDTPKKRTKCHQKEV